ncbi:MAG: DUF3754 domain-containing protein [Planctomycetota bacterium]
MNHLIPPTPVDSTSSPLAMADAWSTSGWIPADAAHWDIEPFVPVPEHQLRCWLNAEAVDWTAFDRVINDVIDRWTGSRCRAAMESYRPIDPDEDWQMRHFETQDAAGNEAASAGSEAPNTDSEAVSTDSEAPNTVSGPEGIDSLLEDIRQLTQTGGYTPLDQEEIEECAGVASKWGVPLHVNFDLFERLHVYARGDVIGRRVRRDWRSLYRRKVVEVPIYQRMVIAFQMRAGEKIDEMIDPTVVLPSDADVLHLRIFKNIPKQDIDMLLPGSRVKISGVDRVKIILPSLGGFLLSLRKIAQFTILLAALALHWFAILIALLIGYLIKSVMSYFQTKNRYQLNLTRNLYFQKLDTNAGVLSTLVDQAASQRRCEAALAYFAIATSDQAPGTRRIKRRVERFIREKIQVEFEFQVAPALSLLSDAGLIRRDCERWTLA